jgi:hypothetical protein
MDEIILNKLSKAVLNCRKILEESSLGKKDGEVWQQLERYYGITPRGEFLENFASRVTQGQLAERQDIIASIQHIEAQGVSRVKATEQFVRETAFTILNRLAALKLLEHPSRGLDQRGLIYESIGNGKESKGFQQFRKVSPDACRPAMNGDVPDGGYRLYLECLYDDLAVELGVLFDRNNSQSIIFPSDNCLKNISEILNAEELAPVWAADETIGWIYQYFTPDEQRKKARKESSAPRNSYELAFRNQFFTPRYVVEFLTDNTLGRTWIEMRGGETQLVDECGYLVQQPDAGDTTHRAKKDPREIKVLDPACGSGHFLLYAYDLLQIIYEEAWADEEAPIFSESGRTLRQDYAEEQEFRRHVPSLILRHNLHGIDIDLRAAQIAALALWLRTQRAYREQRLKMAERPVITRTNIVCAEAMPGESEMLEEFAREVQPPLVGHLMREVTAKMELAGEAGSLLKIEEDIRDAVEEAKKRWRTRAAKERDTLFEHSKLPDVSTNLFDVSGIADEAFWSDIEGNVVIALKEYAEQASNGGTFTRRLFADDAAQGFAFVDICRRKFDVVLMNPPFGDASLPSKKYIDETYADTKGDVYKAFVECFQDRLVPGGMLGIISSRTGFFLSGSSDWRERIVLRLYRPLVLADLGMGVLDAMVETAAYVLRSLTEEEDRRLTLQLVPELRKISVDKRKEFSTRKYEKERGLKRHQATGELRRLEAAGLIKPVDANFPKWRQRTRQVDKVDVPPNASYPSLACLRLLGEKDKEAVLREVLENKMHARTFIVQPEDFKRLPNMPLSYWISSNVQLFFVNLPLFEGSGRTAQHGLSTKNDFRFLRLWWEVSAATLCPPHAHPAGATGIYSVLSSHKWFPFAKGGAHSPYYSDLHLVVDWFRNGEEIETYILGKYPYLKGKAEWVLHRECNYFRPGLTWTRRTTSEFSVRALPAGSLFADKGPSVFTPHETQYLGLLQSSTFSYLLSAQHGAPDAAARSYEAGIIQSTPVPATEASELEHFTRPVQSAINLKRYFDSVNDTSHVFHLPALLQVTGDTLTERTASWRKQVDHAKQRLSEIQNEVDDIAYRLYGIKDEDRRAMALTAKTHASAPDEETEDAEESDVEQAPTDGRQLAVGLISYVVGCLFGRWDVRLAVRAARGDLTRPQLPDPFAPLPVCSPGMLTDHEGFPLRAAPPDYPLALDTGGILVDDEHHRDDIVRRTREVLHLLWGDSAGQIEAEACQMLGVRSLRDYFRNPRDFFEDHIKRYSKSRRRAPIYWLLQSPSRSYALWLYYPQLNRDTLLKALEPDGYVESKIRGTISVLRELQDRFEQTKDTLPRKEQREQERLIEVQAALVTELTQFKEHLASVANSGFDPDLNDGVVLNAAPFHEVMPWPEAKKYWKELQAGKYVWSTVAQNVIKKQ